MGAAGGAARALAHGAAHGRARRGGLRRAVALVGRGPRGLLGGRSGSASTSAATFERVLADASMPGAVWFPGAALNYAERLFRGKPDERVAIVHASELRGLEEWTWGELRDRTAAHPRRAGRARRRPGRPRRRVPAQRAGDDRGVPGDGVARARCGPRRRPSSARAACATASARSSRRCCWRSTATATAAATSTGARRSRRSARRSARRSCACGYLDGAGWEDGFLGDGAARVRAGAVRPPALGPLLLGHDRAAEGDRAGAGRDPARAPEDDVPAPGRRTRATACSGSPRPAG